MPAIRIFHQCVYRVVDHLPNASAVVDVRLRDGGYQRLPWLGMICEHAAERLPGVGYVKIRAIEVTAGDGIARCEWRQVADGQHVLGWRVETLSGQAVYGVVDSSLWPIIIGDRGRKGAPRLKLVA